MKSENYKQLLLNDFENKEMTKEDLDNTLMHFAKLYHEEQFNWVSIKDSKSPELVTNVMIKYKDGTKAVALFDGDGRYYIEKDDRDITDSIISWHKLP